MLIFLKYVFYFQFKKWTHLWEVLHTKGFQCLLMAHIYESWFCLWIFRLEAPFQLLAAVVLAWRNSGIAFRHYLLPSLYTSGIMLSWDWMYSLSAHLEEMCIPWENLKLVYDKPQKSAIPIVLFLGDSHLTGRGFSWVHNKKGFILVVVLYL